MTMTVLKFVNSKHSPQTFNTLTSIVEDKLLPSA